MRQLVVEFVGVHGAGKTTTCHGVTSLLREQGYPVQARAGVGPRDFRSVRERKGLRRGYAFLRLTHFVCGLAFACPDLAAHYVALTITCGTLHRSQRPPWGYFAAFQFHALRRLNRRNADYPGGIILFEESVYNDIPNAARLTPSAAAAWVLRETPSEREMVNRLFVFVECQAAVLKNRLTSREGHPRSKLLVAEPSQIEARCATMDAVRIAVEALAQERESMQVLVVRTDSGASVQQAAGQVSDHIAAIWSQLLELQ